MCDRASNVFCLLTSIKIQRDHDGREDWREEGSVDNSYARTAQEKKAVTKNRVKREAQLRTVELLRPAAITDQPSRTSWTGLPFVFPLEIATSYCTFVFHTVAEFAHLQPKFKFNQFFFRFIRSEYWLERDVQLHLHRYESIFISQFYILNDNFFVFIFFAI